MKETKKLNAKNNLTELVFILDRSGSMASLEKDTIGGFNALIEKQKREKGDCFVSTVLFNNRSEVLHDRVPLDKVNPLTDKDYTAFGGTALIDALGGAIHHIANIHRYARPEDVPAHTLFVITTDGMENASHYYSADEVRKMVEKEQTKYGWEFLFIGANIDAVETAGRYGIAANRAANYCADEQGTRVVYDAVSDAVECMRNRCAMPANWNGKIEKDYQTRK